MFLLYLSSSIANAFYTGSLYILICPEMESAFCMDLYHPKGLHVKIWVLCSFSFLCSFSMSPQAITCYLSDVVYNIISMKIIQLFLLPGKKVRVFSEPAYSKQGTVQNVVVGPGPQLPNTLCIWVGINRSCASYASESQG